MILNSYKLLFSFFCGVDIVFGVEDIKKINIKFLILSCIGINEETEEKLIIVV